jgi:hypothetical protein
MTDTIRFHYPGRQFGRKCEKCGKKMTDHAHIDVDERGRIVACSIKEGIKK